MTPHAAFAYSVEHGSKSDEDCTTALVSMSAKCLGGHALPVLQEDILNAR